MRDCFFCFWDRFVDLCLLRLGVFFFLSFLSGVGYVRCCYLVIVGDDMSIVCNLLLWLCNVDPLLSILLLLGPGDFFCGRLWRTWSSGLL